MRKRTEEQLVLDALFQRVADDDEFFEQLTLPDLRKVAQGNMKSALHMAKVLDQLIEQIEYLQHEVADLKQRTAVQEVHEVLKGVKNEEGRDPNLS